MKRKSQRYIHRIWNNLRWTSEQRESQVIHYAGRRSYIQVQQRDR